MRQNVIMPKRPTHACYRRQRGAVALVVAMVLLFGMTLVLFFMGRGMVFEQKASANQYRSTRAFEMAEAGLEWATAMLNNPAVLNTSCAAGAGAVNFLDRYAPRVAGDYTPPANARAGCRLAVNGTLTCSCPAAGTAPNLGTATDGKFTVRVEDEPADPAAVRLTAWGCTNNASTDCSAATGGAGDATAVAQVTLKLRPILRAVPAAALTTGGWAQVCGSFNIVNTSAGANGYLVNSGGETQIGGTYTSLVGGESDPGWPTCGGGGGQTLTTVPGTPIAAAMATEDSSLSSISGSSEAMFAAFFGTTLSQYRESPSTCTLPDAGNGWAADRDGLAAAYSSGRRCRNFWINGDLGVSGNISLGSSADPVVIASSSDMTFNGTIDIYGVVFSDSADWNDLGTGTSRIYGAVISRVNYRNNGDGRIEYDIDALSNVRAQGRLVRVPGTWRDFQ